jgi:uncharacterized protein YycO
MSDERIGKRIDLVLDAAEELGYSIGDTHIVAMVSSLERRTGSRGAFTRWATLGGVPEASDLAELAMTAAESDPALEDVLDKLAVNYMFEQATTTLPTSEHHQELITAAINANTDLQSRLLRVANRYLGRGPVDAALPSNDKRIVSAAIAIDAKGYSDPTVKKDRPDAVKDVLSLKDVASEEQEKQQNHIPMRAEDPYVQGDYTYLHIVWAPEDVKVGGQALVNHIKSYVKRLSSTKHKVDYGFISAVHVDSIDTEAGTATVHFMSTRKGPAVTKVKTEGK